MSKKSKVTDHGAGMVANAKKLMPEFGKGGKSCFAKGGAVKPVKLAAGGVAKIRHNQASKSGSPKAAKRGG